MKYLAGIRHTQIRLGLPEPREFSSLPRLKLVQAGISRVHALAPPSQRKTRIRLPITPAILHSVHQLWSPRAADHDIVILWAAASLCFFGFFRAGEITVPSSAAMDTRKHLCWGDVTIDSTQSPSLVQVHLKQSKTDQLRKGMDVFVGKTGCPLCPVVAVIAYMTARGNQPGPFFQLRNGTPLTKAMFTKKDQTGTSRAWAALWRLREPQFSHWGSHGSCKRRRGGLHHQGPWPMEQ